MIYQGSCCVLAITAHLRALLVGNALLNLILICRQETATHVDILIAFAVIQLAYQGTVKRQLDRPNSLGHGLDIIEQHFLGRVLVVEDVLLQFSRVDKVFPSLPNYDKIREKPANKKSSP